jgi:hypothetical protein
MDSKCWPGIRSEEGSMVRLMSRCARRGGIAVAFALCASLFAFSARALMPTITSVSPNPVTGSSSPQQFTIFGFNFQSGCTVTLRDVTAAQTFTNRTISSQSSTQIVLNPNFTTAAHSWTVEVINPGPVPSGQYSFTVISPQTLTADLSASATGGTAPLNGVSLTATAGGTATGTINYTFYCNRSDAGTNITGGYDGKFDGVTANPKTFSPCSYASPGTYYAKVIIERGTLAAQKQVIVTVSQPTLNVTLAPSTSSGTAPLNGVTLTATVSGTATGTINYTFYCNRSDTGTNITGGYDGKFDGITTNPRTFSSCGYSAPGTYYAKVIVERGALAAQAQAVITVSQPQQTLTADLSASTTSGTAPLGGVSLTATAGGTATGSINYTFYCNRSDAGTNITGGYDGKFDGVTTNPKTFSPCSYPNPGTYYAKVIIERGSLAAQKQVVITVAQPTLNVSLNPSTSSGAAPLNGVTLTADVSGTAQGTINYTFYCNRADAGTNITGGYDGKYDGVTTNPKVFSACNYSTPGTYYAKVIAERGGLAAQAQASITVTQPQQTLTADLSAGTTSGTAPLNGVNLTATAGGTATGTINYTFYCNRSDTGTNVTGGYDGKFDGITNNPKTFSPCNYSNPGTYYAKVIIERGSLAAQKQVVITVGQQTLSVNLTPSPANGPAPLNGVTLTAVVSGTAAGTINYTFYCDRADTGTNVTNPSDGKFDGTTTNPRTFSGCNYAVPGTYHAKVIAERGGLAAQAQATITVTQSQGQTLTADLSADFASGTAPLNGVTLTATAGGTATGTINYTFYCNRSDNGMNVTVPSDGKFDGVTANPKTFAPCNYPNPGIYYAKVIIERGSLAAQKQVTINVGQPAPALNVSLSPSTSNGTAPLNGVTLAAAVSGSAAGTINYTFYCDRADTGTNITTPSDGKFDGITTNPKTFGPCNYPNPGTYRPKVIAERGGLAAQAQATITVTQSQQNLSADLSADRTNGNAPLNGVTLTATAGGTATGTINYTFYCDRSDTGTNITTPSDGKFVGITNNPKIFGPCNYPNPGIYYAKVIIERGSSVAQKQLPISVGQPAPPALNASLLAEPASGTAPLRSKLSVEALGTATGKINYTLWWACNEDGVNVGALMGLCGAISTPPPGTCTGTSGDKGWKCNAVDAASMKIDHDFGPGRHTVKLVIERGTSVAESRTAVLVGARLENRLYFPVRGKTPFSAPIVSVFDHTMASPYHARAKDPAITAFTGETATVQDSCSPVIVGDETLYEREETTGDEFLINGNFTGDCTKSSLPYDGHAGIDYGFHDTPLYPALSGCVHYPHDSNHTLEINPNCMPDCTAACLEKDDVGYTVQYLHLSTYPDEKDPRKIVRYASKEACPKCAVEGQIVTPDIADPIAYTGDYSGGWGGVPEHLHFQVKKDGTRVDPYGWAIPDLPDPFPYPVENTYLWRDVRLNSLGQPYRVPTARFVITSSSGFVVRSGDTFYAPSSETAALTFDATTSDFGDGGSIRKWRWYINGKLEPLARTMTWSKRLPAGDYLIVVTAQDGNGAVGSARARLVIPKAKGRAARH